MKKLKEKMEKHSLFNVNTNEAFPTFGVCKCLSHYISLDHKQLVDDKENTAGYTAAKYLSPLQPKQQLYQVCN